ncbi:MAG: peptidase M13 [Flavobacteriales bacterium]|nr:peptidase M13 [Flavobacteriales bacterium]
MKKFVSLLVIVVITINTIAQEEIKNLKTLEFDYMDLSVAPSDDFYQYATGTWMKNNPVPESESRWSSFNQLSEENNVVLNEILERISALENVDIGTDVQLLADFYRSFMDTINRNKVSVQPVSRHYRSIEKTFTVNDLQKAIAFSQNMGFSSLFGLYVAQDKKNNSLYRVHLYQGGMGLPNRDYYFKKDKRSEKIRLAYKEFMSKMFKLGNISSPSSVERVYKIEEQIASVCKSPVELREVEKQYNTYTVDGLNNLCPNIKWTDFLTSRGISAQDTIIVGQPEFFEGINQLMDSISIEDWKNYFKWNIFRSVSGALSMECKRLSFGFYSTTLRGTKKMKPLWKQGIQAVTSSAIGELLGKEFVEQNFSPNAKEIVNVMVDNITLVFEDRINSLDWMSDSTKVKAKEKLAAFSRKLGFPDKWEDFSSINITKGNYLDNVINCRKYSIQKNISKLGKPIDKTKWSMFPQIVNAYYSPLLNEIVFPAGIMQKPFFSEEYEDAVNYARMGAVIGHELTHGFDDNGSKFSADGRMFNWWTKEDKEKFDAKTQKLVDQYNSFEALDGVFVNGKLTLGENIADLGGLTIAYYAFLKSLEGKAQKNINGYTPQQRFFIAFAHVWKNTIRDNALEARIKSDSHSPGKYRVNGTLANMPEFFEAFNINEGDPMRQSENKIARIW